MTTILISSSIIGISSLNWMIAWLMMEMNTMAMCFLVSKDMNKSKEKKTNVMKYFLVQMMASTFIIILISSQKTNNTITLMMMMSLMIKMGAWPFHLWYLSMISTTSLKNKSLMLIMTWQKVLPAMLMSMMCSSNSMKLVIMAMCLMSFLSPLSKVKAMPNNKIMALSSLNNNGWIILSALVSMKLVMIFLMVYSTTIWMTMSPLSKKALTMSKKISYILMYLMLFVNLSGMPPLSMFWMKIMVMNTSIYNNVNSNALTLMLIMSCVMVSLYLIMMLNYFMKKNNKNQNMTMTIKYKKTLLYYSSVIIMLYLTLGNLSSTKQDLSW